MTSTRRPAPWPWPADTVLDRARRVAGSYREALLRADPLACAQLDDWAKAHGQGWAVPSPWPYGDEELITRREVADLLHVDLRTVYVWHRRGLRYTDTADGVRVKVADLQDWLRQRRLARRKGV